MNDDDSTPTFGVGEAGMILFVDNVIELNSPSTKQCDQSQACPDKSHDEAVNDGESIWTELDMPRSPQRGNVDFGEKDSVEKLLEPPLSQSSGITGSTEQEVSGSSQASSDQPKKKNNERKRKEDSESYKRCKYCPGYFFLYRTTLRNHIAKVHPDKVCLQSDVHPCSFCSRVLSSSVNLKAHVRTKHQTYICQNCGEGLVGSKDKRNHDMKCSPDQSDANTSSNLTRGGLRFKFNVDYNLNGSSKKKKKKDKEFRNYLKTYDNFVAVGKENFTIVPPLIIGSNLSKENKKKSKKTSPLKRVKKARADFEKALVAKKEKQGQLNETTRAGPMEEKKHCELSFCLICNQHFLFEFDLQMHGCQSFGNFDGVLNLKINENVDFWGKAQPLLF